MRTGCGVVLLAALLAAVAGCSPSRAPPAQKGQGEAKTADKNPLVVIETSLGKITVQLDSVKAPITVKNFMRYVDEKFHDGTVFHRVISNFMIQGGGLTPDMVQKPTHEPIANEAGNGLKNRRATIAMARAPEVNSATAQFFINVEDNGRLDHTDNTPDGFGYAVFGKVIDGMDTVDKIRQVPTIMKGVKDQPESPVVILSVRRAAAPQSPPSTEP